MQEEQRAEERKRIEAKKRNNLSVFALLMVAVLGAVGVTIAYFTSTDTFTNTFGTKPYSIQVKETFESPTDWTPGTTTNKTVSATNMGDVDAAVRVSFEESWKDSADGDLDLVDSTTGERAAIINYADGYLTKWKEVTEEVNGREKTYYYYKTKLAKNAATTSLIQSVTFNPNVTISSADNCVTDNTNHTKTCTTTTTGYAGGTYTLEITVETVQYDQYRTAWGTTVAIS